VKLRAVDSVLACALVSGVALAACAKSGEPDGAGGQTGGGSGGTTGAGTGGSTASGGATGTGTGGRLGGAGGQTGGGSGGTTGAGTGGSTAVACPTGATFCSGFEQAGMPAGTTYRVNAAPGDWSRDFAQDTTMHNGGAASLRVKPGTEAGTSGSAYKMLAVTAPSGKFWVRFYVRSDRDLGEVDPTAPGDGLHNAFAEAAGSDDPNDGVILEFAQDAGVAFNSHDDVRWPTGFGRVGGAIVAYTLPKDTWHCIEISFDSGTRVQTLFVNGVQKINATDYPMAAQVGRPFATFRFGYMQFHGQPRTMWYDDVAVGPNRMPCL